MSTFPESATALYIQFCIALVQSCICFGCLLFVVCKCRNPLGGDRQPRRRIIPYHFEILRRYQKAVSLFIILGLISFVITSITQAIYSYIFIWKDYQHFVVEMFVLEFINIFFWSYGQFCCYSVFLLRLIDVFSGSPFHVKRCPIILLVTMVILYELVWIVNCVATFIYWMEYWNVFDISHKKLFDQIKNFTLIPTLILDVLITITMTHLFLSRLFKDMHSQIKNENDQDMRMIKLSQSLSGGHANQRMMSLGVKASVLSITTLLSSLLWVAPEAVAVFLELPGTRTFCYIIDLWQQIDTVISCVCLVLFLTKATRLYRALCCCCICVGSRLLRRRLLHQPVERPPLFFTLELDPNHGIDRIDSD